MVLSFLQINCIAPELPGLWLPPQVTACLLLLVRPLTLQSVVSREVKYLDVYSFVHRCPQMHWQTKNTLTGGCPPLPSLIMNIILKRACGVLEQRDQPPTCVTRSEWGANLLQVDGECWGMSNCAMLKFSIRCLDKGMRYATCNYLR